MQRYKHIALLTSSHRFLASKPELSRFLLEPHREPLSRSSIYNHLKQWGLTQHLLLQRLPADLEVALRP